MCALIVILANIFCFTYSFSRRNKFSFPEDFQETVTILNKTLCLVHISLAITKPFSGGVVQMQLVVIKNFHHIFSGGPHNYSSCVKIILTQGGHREKRTAAAVNEKCE